MIRVVGRRERGEGATWIQGARRNPDEGRLGKGEVHDRRVGRGRMSTMECRSRERKVETEAATEAAGCWLWSEKRTRSWEVLQSVSRASNKHTCQGLASVIRHPSSVIPHFPLHTPHPRPPSRPSHRSQPYPASPLDDRPTPDPPRTHHRPRALLAEGASSPRLCPWTHPSTARRQSRGACPRRDRRLSMGLACWRGSRGRGVGLELFDEKK